MVTNIRGKIEKMFWATWSWRRQQEMRSGAAFKIAFQPVSWVKGVRIIKEGNREL